MKQGTCGTAFSRGRAARTAHVLRAGAFALATLITSPLAQAVQPACPTREPPPPPRLMRGPPGGLDFLSGLLEWRFYLLMAAAVVTALYLLFRWLAQRQASVRQLSAPVSSELQSLSLADLLQAAQAEASGGHYRLALRHLHTAVLIYLDRLGILNYEPTKTDWEHLQALRRRGRDFVLPDDVKYLALPILRHRLILKPEAEIEGIKPDPAIQTLVDAISVPR